MKYERLTKRSDDLGKLFSYVHAKGDELYIYDEQDNDVPLAEYIAKHCACNADMQITAEEFISGDICADCEGCTAGILNFVAIQAACLYRRLADLEDGLDDLEIISTKKAAVKKEGTND